MPKKKISKKTVKKPSKLSKPIVKKKVAKKAPFKIKRVDDDPKDLKEEFKVDDNPNKVTTEIIINDGIVFVNPIYNPFDENNKN